MTEPQDPNQQPTPEPNQQPPFWPPPASPPGQSYGPPPGQQYGPPPQPYGGYPGAPPAPVGYVPPGGLVLPPGVELASVGRRIGAFFLRIPLAIITLGIGYLIWGAVLWTKGTSPALKVLGMKVYRIDTREVPGFWWMALRNIVGTIVESILSIITLLVSFILFCSTEKRQSLHDMISSTTVVYDPNNVLKS